MFQIGWWTTGRDEAAVVLFNETINAIKKGEITAEIAYLFLSKAINDNSHCKELKSIADTNNIVTVSLSSNDFNTELKKQDMLKWRELYHENILIMLKDFKTDLIVLAGYMWIVSPNACEQLDMINLHPALPDGPTGTWQDVIWQLIEKNSKTTGVMMHLVTPDLDRGPAVTFCEFEIQGPAWERLWKDAKELLNKTGLIDLKKQYEEGLPLFHKIREEGIKREIPCILQTIKAFSRSEIQIKGKKLTDNKGNFLDKPYNLSDKV